MSQKQQERQKANQKAKISTPNHGSKVPPFLPQFAFFAIKFLKFRAVYQSGDGSKEHHHVAVDAFSLAHNDHL
jgi:hypothetical protein